MIAQFLNSAIVVLLILLVAVPAAMAITKTMRESANRRQTARVRGRHAVLPPGPAVPLHAAKRRPQHPTALAHRATGQVPRERESSAIHRRLREDKQNPQQITPGDRADSRSEQPPRG